MNRGTDASVIMAEDVGKWSLGGKVLEIVDDYKYLGVRFVGKGGWKVRRAELLSKARGSFWKAYGLGMGGGGLSVEGSASLWKAVVRSVLEYGGEIDSGRWEEAEAFQRLAGRMALGVGRRVADEVVVGELGWWSVQARREMARLVYWGNIVAHKSGTMVGDVYAEGRRRMAKGEARAGEWCVETKRLMVELGLGDVWESEDVANQGNWPRLVMGLIQKREQIAWWESMAGVGRRKGKTKLLRYSRIKTTLRAEWFLRENRTWVRRWVKLRAGVENLEVEMGRWKGTARCDRVCRHCRNGVEDVDHFLDKCDAWSDGRGEMRMRVRQGNEKRWAVALYWPTEARVDWILRGGSAGKRRKLDVMRSVVGMVYARDRISPRPALVGTTRVRTDYVRRAASVVANAAALVVIRRRQAAEAANVAAMAAALAAAPAMRSS